MVELAGELEEAVARTAAARARRRARARRARTRCARGSTRSGSTPARRVVALADVGAGRDASATRALARLAPRARAPRPARARWPDLEAVVAGDALAALRDAEAIARSTRSTASRAPAEYRDDNTPEHTQRVGALAARLARRLGLPDREVRLVRRAAPLHDLGKIAIPDSILLKPGRLDRGGVRGRQDARRARRARPRGRRRGALRGRRAHRPQHHERWDGGGYPRRPRRRRDPARRPASCTSPTSSTCWCTSAPTRRRGRSGRRPRRSARGAGTQFDPAVVEAFEALGAGGLGGRARVQLTRPGSRPGRIRAMTEAMSRGRTASIAGAAIALAIACAAAAGVTPPLSSTTAAVQFAPPPAPAAPAGTPVPPAAAARPRPPTAASAPPPRPRTSGPASPSRPAAARTCGRPRTPSRATASPPPRPARDPISRPTPTRWREALDATVCLVNAERVERGLARLGESPRLAEASRRYAADLVAGQYFSHDGPRRLGHRRAPRAAPATSRPTGPGPSARTSPGAPARWRRPGPSSAPG